MIPPLKQGVTLAQPNWPLDADGVSQLVSDVIAATGGKEKNRRGYTKAAGWFTSP